MDLVKTFLSQKDGDYSGYIPDSFKITEEEKNKLLLA
jgi:hypothetical protein